VAIKGGVRGDGAVGWLLAMAQETGGGPVRHGRGVGDGGARPACPRRKTRAGPARQGGRRGEGRVGRLAGEPLWGRGEVGCGWVKNQKCAKVQKEILFKFQLILEIWQKFGKLHKEI
jgi:hypothetical protein